MKRFMPSVLVVLALTCAAQADIHMSAVQVPITAAGVPAGAVCWDIMATSDNDIVGFEIKWINGTLWNEVAFGDDFGPKTALFGFVPALEFDSYISMPGPILLAAGTLGDPTALPMAWIDNTNDGAQTDFVVMRVTILNPFGLGIMLVDSTENVGGAPVVTEHYIVPEPATMSLLALGGLALLRKRR